MAEPPQPRGTKTPDHVTQFLQLPNFSKIKARKLADAFATAEDLAAAPLEDIKRVKGIGPEVARMLHRVVSGAATVSSYAGEERVVVWNKITKKKVAGAAAPKASQADTWLAKNAEVYERYVNQDAQVEGPKDPSTVPYDCLMSAEEYDNFCAEEDDGHGPARLLATLAEYGLRKEALPESGGSGQPHGTLDFALLHVATAADQADTLPLQLALALTPQNSIQGKLTLVRGMLKRPVRIFTSRPGVQNVYEHEADDEIAETATPIRLSQCGGTFHALIEADTEAKDDMEVDSTVVDGAAVVPLPADGEDAHLPDLKDHLDSRLADVLGLIDDVVEWSKGLAGAPYDFSIQRQDIETLRERLKNGNGLEAAFLGDNGIGKSTIANLLMLNSSVEGYLDLSSDYVPEAMLDKSAEPPSFNELLSGPESIEDGVIRVVKLAPQVERFAALKQEFGLDSREAAAIAKGTFEAAEASIRDHCERASDSKPALKNFVLPCTKNGKTNTAVKTHARFGSVVHMMVELYTIEELQDQAFKFVTLRRNLEEEGKDVDELSQDETDYLEEVWHLYLNITDGPIKEGDLPDPSGLFDRVPSEKVMELPATVNDVPVCEAMRAIVASPIVLYLPPGKSMHLDRVLVHDQLAAFQDKDSLYHYAIKKLETFQPSAVLEGGNGFMDLPGHDKNTRCQQQTREGIKEAGVVFVVLKKNLRGDKDSIELLERTDTIKRVAAGEANVVFLFNREVGPGYVRGQLSTDKELKTVEDCEKGTREEWLKKLKAANNAARRNGDSFKTEEEIIRIAEDTQMCAIYPMIHTSLKLNWQWSEQHKEETEAILKHTNMHWLLGILEKLNRQSLVDSLKLIATDTMPGLKDYLKTKLQDAQSLQATEATQLPKQIVDKANKILSSRGTETSALGMQSATAVQKVQDLFSRDGAKRQAASSLSAADDAMMHGTRSGGMRHAAVEASGSELQEGQEVLIVGIMHQPHFNGKRGRVQGLTLDGSRYKVEIEGESNWKALRRECLIVVDAVAAAAGNAEALAVGSATSASSEGRSYRKQISDMIRSFMQEHGQAFLTNNIASANERWEKTQKQLTRFATALRVIDPRNKGTLQSCPLLPAVFGGKANRKEMDIDFEPLLTSLNDKLQELLEDVVESVVVKGVDALLQADKSHISTVILKEGFIESDVLKPLKQRFSVHGFFKHGSQLIQSAREPELISNQVNKFLRREAAKQLEVAVTRHILSKNTTVGSVEGVKKLIADGREPARQQWLENCQNKIEGIVIGQLDGLCKALMGYKGYMKAISARSLLTSFMQYIVNADAMTKSAPLQNNLRRLINLQSQKTDSLHSLWARLDKPEEAAMLGEAAARHVEIRRMREITVHNATSIRHFIGAPDKPMHSQGLHPQHSQRDKVFSRDDALQVFALGEPDAMLPLSRELMQRYGLDIVKRSASSSVGFADLFSAVALVAYRSATIRKAREPDTAHEQVQAMNEQIKLAGLQLRAVAAAEISTYYSKPKRKDECDKMAKLLGMPIETYVDRLRSADSSGDMYSGDLLCVYFLARFLEKNFRVWLPSVGSLFVPHNPYSENGRTAYNIILTAEAPTHGSPPATTYQAMWFPTQRPTSMAAPAIGSGGGGGGGGGGSARRFTVRFDEAAPQISEIVMSDEEVDARRGPFLPNGQPRAQKRPRDT